jgi:hypothetical protein
VADGTGLCGWLFCGFCGVCAREGAARVGVLGLTCATGAKTGSGEPAVAGGCQADGVGDGRALGGADGARDGLGVGLRDGLDGLGDGLGGLGDDLDGLGVGVAVGVADGVGAGVAVGVADGLGDAEAAGVTEGATDDDGVVEGAVPGDGLAEAKVVGDRLVEDEAATPGEQARAAAAQAVRVPRTASALRPAPADIRPPCLDYPDIQWEQCPKPDIYYPESRRCPSRRWSKSTGGKRQLTASDLCGSWRPVLLWQDQPKPR